MLKLKISIILLNIYFTFCSPNKQSTNWDDLKVTWGSPLDPTKFVSMPRTVADAIQQGWKKEKDCSQVNGNRYILNGDYSVILIYNTAGNIAGIGTAVPKGLPFNFPSNNLKKLFYDEGNYYTINAYFTDPNTICSSLKTTSNLITGDRLVFKGSGFEINVPLEERNLTTYWSQGQCFRTMGVHYWANINGIPITEDIDGDDFFPAFLQYNRGKLNGFGWAFNADLNSIRYEHPTPPVFGLFFKTIPKFFSDPAKAGVLTTLHIYLDSTPQFNNC